MFHISSRLFYIGTASKRYYQKNIVVILGSVYLFIVVYCALRVVEVEYDGESISQIVFVMETLQSTRVVIFQFPDESVKVSNFATSMHLRRIQWNGLVFQGVNV